MCVGSPLAVMREMSLVRFGMVRPHRCIAYGREDVGTYI
jgi:hypothetical protein